MAVHSEHNKKNEPNQHTDTHTMIKLERLNTHTHKIEILLLLFFLNVVIFALTTLTERRKSKVFC